jgi:hypothetical protein
MSCIPEKKGRAKIRRSRERMDIRRRGKRQPLHFAVDQLRFPTFSGISNAESLLDQAVKDPGASAQGPAFLRSRGCRRRLDAVFPMADLLGGSRSSTGRKTKIASPVL